MRARAITVNLLLLSFAAGFFSCGKEKEDIKTQTNQPPVTQQQITQPPAEQITPPQIQEKIPTDRIDKVKSDKKWMKTNKEAFEGTKLIDNYYENKTFLFEGKNGIIYAVYTCDEEDKIVPPRFMVVRLMADEKSEIFLLGYDKPLLFTVKKFGTLVYLPEELQKGIPDKRGYVLKFNKAVYGG